MKKRAVMVTTQHRGVFFGYVKAPLKNGAVTITDARNCLYWSADMKGFMGLAANGPSKSCRVGPAVPAITLTGVTSVSEVSADAETKWTNAPWS
jgi:hypothetical protein